MRKKSPEESLHQGIADATKDIQQERLIVKTYGLLAPWHGRWRELLQSKFGIEVDIVSGCVVSEELVDYVAGYNGVTKEHIKKRFGEEALEDLALQAKAEFQALGVTTGHSSLFAHNENPEITVLMDEFGWVTCPHCERRFATYSTSSWDGKAHISCGQKLRLLAT
jgi:hypothetical protein